MNDRPLKIILACGGTGGHIFPAFSLAEELKKRDPLVQVVYVCGKLDIEEAIFKPMRKEKVVSIESAPFRGASSLGRPSFILKLMSGFFSSLGILFREKPDLVVGFGGYFSFPVVIAAKLCGVPTLLHEQNVFPGKANRFLGRVADAVALSYWETEKYLTPHKNRRVTGNPVRPAIEKDSRQEALRFFEFSPEKKTFLILGGSQGAESINTLFLDSLEFLSAAFKSGSQVLHLCGKLAPEKTLERCRAAGLQAKAYSFFERMDLAYGATDVAFGRAGATFLAEIATKKIPAILVPYPHADGHQRFNAEVFAEGHQAVVVEQSAMTPQKLASLLEASAAKIKPGERAVSGDHPTSAGNAREKLADFVSEILLKKKHAK